MAPLTAMIENPEYVDGRKLQHIDLVKIRSQASFRPGPTAGTSLPSTSKYVT